MIKEPYSVRPDKGQGLSGQCKKVRKERKGRKKKKYSAQGEGVDNRGLTASERALLRRIKFMGFL